MFGVAVFEAIEVKGRSMLNFEVMTSTIISEHPLTLMASKTITPNIFKITSIQCISCKY